MRSDAAHDPYGPDAASPLLSGRRATVCHKTARSENRQPFRQMSSLTTWLCPWAGIRESVEMLGIKLLGALP